MQSDTIVRIKRLWMGTHFEFVAHLLLVNGEIREVRVKAAEVASYSRFVVACLSAGGIVFDNSDFTGRHGAQTWKDTLAMKVEG